MICIARQCDRHGHAPQIEQDLMQFGSVLVMPEALNESGGAAYEERLRKAQLDNTEKDKYKEDRHAAGDGRQDNFQTRGENGQGEIAEKARYVLGFPVPELLDQENSAEQRYRRDVDSCKYRHAALNRLVEARSSPTRIPFIYRRRGVKRSVKKGQSVFFRRSPVGTLCLMVLGGISVLYLTILLPTYYSAALMQARQCR